PRPHLPDDRARRGCHARPRTPLAFFLPLFPTILCLLEIPMRMRTLVPAALLLALSSTAFLAQTPPTPPAAASPAPAAAAAAKPAKPAPTGSLAGKVTRSKDGAPLAGASVTVTPSQGGRFRATKSAAD